MILTVAGIAAISAIFSALFPVFNQGVDSISPASAEVDQRLITLVEIVQVVGELDASGSFSDTNANGEFEIFIWVKNTGKARIDDISRTDLFIGSPGSSARVPHEAELEEGEYPRWNYSIEDSSDEWAPGVTLKITVRYSSTQDAGHYDAKISTPKGATHDYHFKM